MAPLTAAACATDGAADAASNGKADRSRMWGKGVRRRSIDTSGVGQGRGRIVALPVEGAKLPAGSGAVETGRAGRRVMRKGAHGNSQRAYQGCMAGVKSTRAPSRTSHSIGSANAGGNHHQYLASAAIDKDKLAEELVECDLKLSSRLLPAGQSAEAGEWRPAS